MRKCELSCVSQTCNCLKIAQGRSIAAISAEGREAIERAGFVLDYIEARHAETLMPVKSIEDGPVRLLVAAKLGKTRLIRAAGVVKVPGCIALAHAFLLLMLANELQHLQFPLAD